MAKSDNTTPPNKPVEPKYPPKKTIPPADKRKGK
jgi:hypothetical protein